MSREEATEQYNNALKAGQKYYKAAVAAGRYPYPPALDDFLDESTICARTDLGVINVPSELVIGTKTAGRTFALAGNFMPLMPAASEFHTKWITLCEANLSEEGIRDPVKCWEYMGRFYVEEGNKRVSVLKSYRAPTIPAQVTRLVPTLTDDPGIRSYYEFMAFYRLSGLYTVHFERPGCYAALQALLGMEPDHRWTEAEKRSFAAGFLRLQGALSLVKPKPEDLAPSEALLTWLKLFSFRELKDLPLNEIAARLASLRRDIQDKETLNEAVKTDPVEMQRNFIEKIIAPGHHDHLSAAFIYAYPVASSAWTMGHDAGRRYLESVMPDRLRVKCYTAENRDYLAAMRTAVQEGAEVLFATTPPMMDACRIIAMEHPDLAVFNCSPVKPFADVGTYYARIYEGKFITGAVAGIMAAGNNVGYIANYPINGCIAAVNAFAMGVRMVSPEAKVKLHWSCTENDPIPMFTRKGIRVISNRDGVNPLTPHHTLEWGTYLYDETGRPVPLAAPIWNWGKMYERIIRSIFAGTWAEEKKRKGLNWWGLNTGVIDISLSQDLPEGVHLLADYLKQGIAEGIIDPFGGKILDHNGNLRCGGDHKLTPEEILTMDWLAENVDGRIPPYEDLLPKSRETVRLLGIYKDSIPPEERKEQQL